MAEIATEDGTREEEEEEEPASEERSNTAGKEGDEEGDTTGNEGQTSSQSGASSETNVPQVNLESDSDTEDEEEEEVVTKSSSASDSSIRSNQTAPQTQTGAAQPPLSASRTSSSPSTSPAGGPSVISGITVTESTAPPGTPPSPGRCISVSSPGRGHKIFMVTRVESPPEQQLQLQISAPAVPCQTKEVSKKPVDTNAQPMTQQTPPQPPPQTPTQTQLTQEDAKERSPALSTDCKLTEQRPVAHSECALNTSQTHTLDTQSTSQTAEDVTACTLDLELTNPNPQAPALPSDSSPVQALALQLGEEVIESPKSPQLEPICVEGEKKEDEEKEGPIEDERVVMSPDSTGECQQLEKLSQTQASIPAADTQLEQLQNELASASEDTQSPDQTEEGDKVESLPQEEKQEAPTSLSEIKKPSLTEKENSQPNQEEPSPKQQTEADEQRVESVLSVQTDQQASSVTQSGAQETNPRVEEASKSISPISAMTGSVSPVEEEESPHESSADEVECFAEALEGEVVGSALPNGLKPEFSLHLLDAESPKSGSCVMEHGESQ